MMMIDLGKIQTDASEDVLKQATPRAQKYMRPKLDEFWTQQYASNIQLQGELSKSRTIYGLETSKRDSVEEVSLSHHNLMPEVIAVNDIYAALEGTLPQGDLEADQRGTLETLYTTAIQKSFEADDLEFLGAIANSDEFLSLSLETQSRLNTMILSRGTTRLQNTMEQDVNLIIGGDLGYEDARRQTQLDLEAMKNVLPKQLAADMTLNTYTEFNTAHIEGLIGRQQYDEAEKALTDPDFYRYLTGGPAVWSKRIETAQGTATDNSLTTLSRLVANESAKAANGEKNDLVGTVASLQEFVDSGRGTATQQNRAAFLLEEQAVAGEYIPYTQSIKTQTVGELEAAQLELQGERPVEDDQHYIIRQKMRNNALNAITTEMGNRQVSTFATAQLRDPHISDLWGEVANAWAGGDVNAAAGAYQMFKQEIDKRGQQLGVVNPMGQSYLPDSSVLNTFASYLPADAANIQQVMGNASSMIAMFGDDAVAVAQTMTGGEGTGATAVAFMSVGNNAGAAYVIKGENVFGSLTSKQRTDVTNNFTTKSANSDNIVDWNIYGPKIGKTFSEAVFKYAIGYENQRGTDGVENLQKGQVSEESVKAAYAAIIGPIPFKMGNANTVSYRKEDGSFADSVEMQYKSYQLVFEPGYAADIYGPLYAQTGEILGSSEDVFKRASYLPQGGSVYSVELQSAGADGRWGGEVFQKDASGALVPLKVDFENMTIDQKSMDKYRARYAPDDMGWLPQGAPIW